MIVLEMNCDCQGAAGKVSSAFVVALPGGRGSIFRLRSSMRRRMGRALVSGCFLLGFECR
jgi:hypothetical protein